MCMCLSICTVYTCIYSVDERCCKYIISRNAVLFFVDIIHISNINIMLLLAIGEMKRRADLSYVCEHKKLKIMIIRYDE